MPACYPVGMVAVRNRTHASMTVAEFLAWEPGDPSGRRWQLVDGEPVAMAPGNETHAALQNEIARLLGNHLLERRSPCRALTEPGIVPRVGASRNYRVPDVGVTCAPPSDGPMVPDPILLIEILSRSNEKLTRANVWTYMTIPSVQEILLVQSSRIGAELLRRHQDGQWPEEPAMLGPSDQLHLSSIDFAIPLAALYRTTAIAP
jgi:Uma2 family endonuclease